MVLSGATCRQKPDTAPLRIVFPFKYLIFYLLHGKTVDLVSPPLSSLSKHIRAEWAMGKCDGYLLLFSNKLHRRFIIWENNLLFKHN